MFYSACTKPVVLYGSPQHISGKKHKAKLVIWNDKKKDKQKTIINVNKNLESKALTGQILTEDARAFRLNVLHEVCKTNMTVKSCGYVVPWIEEISCKNMGNIGDLADILLTNAI